MIIPERLLKSEKYRILKWFQAVREKRVKKEEAIKELNKVFKTLTLEEAKKYFHQILLKMEQL